MELRNDMGGHHDDVDRWNGEFTITVNGVMLLWLVIAGVRTESDNTVRDGPFHGVVKEEIGDREDFRKAKRQKPYLPVSEQEPRRMKRHNAVRNIPKMTDVPSRTLESVSTTSNQTNTATDKRSDPEYKIIAVTPTTLLSTGGSVVIEMSEIRGDTILCKFGEIVVMGSLLSDGKISCVYPKINAESVALSVSFDNVHWSRRVILSVISEESDISWGVILVIGVLFGGMIVLAVKGFYVRQKRGRRKKEASALLDEESFYIKDDQNVLYRRQHTEL